VAVVVGMAMVLVIIVLTLLLIMASVGVAVVAMRVTMITPGVRVTVVGVLLLLLLFIIMSPMGVSVASLVRVAMSSMPTLSATGLLLPHCLDGGGIGDHEVMSLVDDPLQGADIGQGGFLGGVASSLNEGPGEEADDHDEGGEAGDVAAGVDELGDDGGKGLRAGLELQQLLDAHLQVIQLHLDPGRVAVGIVGRVPAREVLLLVLHHRVK